jgi:hypothetical protein
MVLDMDMDPAPALEPARSLHEVFQTLAGDPDPDAVLAAAGYAGLPADLLTEAIVSVADTAPPEVAEHLSPVVLGASSDAGLGLELLTSAPQVTWDDDLDAVEEPAWAEEGPALEELDFGAGGDELDALDAPDGDLPDADLPDAEDLADDVPEVEIPVPAAAGDLPDGDLAEEGWGDAWDGEAGDLSGDLPDELPDDLMGEPAADDDLPDA